MDPARSLDSLGGVLVPEGAVVPFPARGPKDPPPRDGVTRRQRNASPGPFPPAVWPPPGGADRGRQGGVIGEPARGGPPYPSGTDPPTPVEG